MDGELGDFETAVETPTSAADDTAFWVPEVSAITFRYFDGATWTSQWNSIQRKALPVAVEVQLQLTQNSDTPPGEQPAEQALDDEFPPDEMLALTDGVQAPESLHRLVFDLPGSPAYRKPRVVPSAKPRPVRPPVRRVTPPRWTPKRKATRGTDQWIRTNSQ